MLSRIPGEIQSELIEGGIADVIVNVAETRNCDLVIMGSLGLGRLASALPGSNSQKVVSEAPCPVLIVR